MIRFVATLLGVIIFCVSTDCLAQTNAKARGDSLRAASKLRSDSIKARRQAVKDSLQQLREAQKEKIFKDNEAKRLAEENLRKRRVQPLTQEICLGYRLNSDGWSFLVHRGFIKNNSAKPLTTFLFFDLSEKRHPKETKTLNENFTVVNPGEPRPVSYKYGKINNFYQLKMGYGAMRPFTGRLDKKSIQISWVYAAGLSLGMVKPYYLDILVPEGSSFVRRTERYSEKNKESFLDTRNQGTIIGGTDFSKGIGEIKLTPGLHIRSGFYFDYSPTRKSYMGVELGASLELYGKQIPIMINTSNQAAFFNIYADIRFGRRWE